MPDLINWDLLKNPINWVIVALMLYLAVFGLNLIMGSANGQGAISLTGST